MHYLVVTAELRVLTFKCVQAMGAGDDNFLRLDLIEYFNILHTLHLEQELITGAAGWIPGAGFAFAQHHEIYPSDIQEFCNRLGGALCPVFKCAGAANPK